MCYLEPDCVSINVGPVARGNQKCELNNATEENHAPFLLVNKPAYTYFAIEVTFFHSQLKWSHSCFRGKLQEVYFDFAYGIAAAAAHV